MILPPLHGEPFTEIGDPHKPVSGERFADDTQRGFDGVLAAGDADLHVHQHFERRIRGAPSRTYDPLHRDVLISLSRAPIPLELSGVQPPFPPHPRLLEPAGNFPKASKRKADGTLFPLLSER
jgi:hypothetical protein